MLPSCGLETDVTIGGDTPRGAYANFCPCAAPAQGRECLWHCRHQTRPPQGHEVAYHHLLPPASGLRAVMVSGVALGWPGWLVPQRGVAVGTEGSAAPCLLPWLVSVLLVQEDNLGVPLAAEAVPGGLSHSIALSPSATEQAECGQGQPRQYPSRAGSASAGKGQAFGDGALHGSACCEVLAAPQSPGAGETFSAKASCAGTATAG